MHDILQAGRHNPNVGTELHREFAAAQVLTNEANGGFVVAFSQHQSGEAPFLTFRRPRLAEGGGGSPGQDLYLIECNGRTWPFPGGVKKAVIHRDCVALTLSEAAAGHLDVPAMLTVRFPRTEQRVSMHFELAQRRLWYLQFAVRTVFANTSTEVINALGKPHSGSPACRLDGHEASQLGWDNVSHCSKCDHLVFLAENDADANALGRLGQCVKLTDSCKGNVVFIGLKLGLGPGERHVVPTLALPSDMRLRQKALDGVFVYLNRHRSFDEAVAILMEGRELVLPSMSWKEARELQRRFEEWGLVVRFLDRETDEVTFTSL
jgi:hypothetical protein